MLKKSMSFLDGIKNAFAGKKNQGPSHEELNSYLQKSRDNLKQSGDYINKFLEGVREFQPARRHEEMFKLDVKERLLVLKNGLSKGILFLNDKLGNTINTSNSIKSINQLSILISEWMIFLKRDDEKAQDLIKIVGTELWGEDRAKRGFPVPKNSDILISYLEGTHTMLTQSKQELENYNMALAGNVQQNTEDI